MIEFNDFSARFLSKPLRESLGMPRTVLRVSSLLQIGHFLDGFEQNCPSEPLLTHGSLVGKQEGDTFRHYSQKRRKEEKTLSVIILRKEEKRRNCSSGFLFKRRKEKKLLFRVSSKRREKRRNCSSGFLQERRKEKKLLFRVSSKRRKRRTALPGFL